MEPSFHHSRVLGALPRHNQLKTADRSLPILTVTSCDASAMTLLGNQSGYTRQSSSSSDDALQNVYPTALPVSPTLAALPTQDSEAAVAPSLPYVDPTDSHFVQLEIMDTNNKKFRLGASEEWTVAQLKEYGRDLHGVSPDQQRLIHMGRQLTEGEETIASYGLTASTLPRIVHLFPKPVIRSNRAECGNEETEATVVGPAPAHVPRILVADEQAALELHRAMNNNASVFEYSYENQRRVKMFSALLILICAMQMLTLFTIMAGIQTVPVQAGEDDGHDPTDPADTGGGGGETRGYEIRRWKNSDYVDLGMSMAGLWVGLTGIKAAQTASYATARLYFVTLVMVGIVWVAFSYYDTFTRAKENAAAQGSEEDDEDIFFSALVASLLTLLIWSMCFYRAYVYQRDLWTRDQQERSLEREREERRVETEHEERHGRRGNEFV